MLICFIQVWCKSKRKTGKIDCEGRTLICNTLTGGDLQLVTTEKDTIAGTFTMSTVFGLTDVILSYDNATYTCTVEGSAPEPGYYFHLKQDLTGEFLVKYPAETINEITITTLCVMHKTE
jgi:hypothetical protein